MGKKDKEPEVEEEDSEDETAPLVCAIAKPLADSKLTKKILKVVKKAAKGKQVRRGVKEVTKALRKKTQGLCVIAGDISPIDVISHVPVVCEDNGVPYIFVPSKEALGAAALTKRPTSVMLVLADPPKGGKGAMDEAAQTEFKGLYEKVYKKAASMAPIFSSA